MIVTDQKISETTPKTFSLDTGTGCGSLGLKTVWTVYSGLVPMSPKTTPRAPSASAPRAAACRFTVTVLRLPAHLKPWRTTLTNGPAEPWDHERMIDPRQPEDPLWYGGEVLHAVRHWNHLAERGVQPDGRCRLATRPAAVAA